jgi:hypothetical protein
MFPEVPADRNTGWPRMLTAGPTHGDPVQAAVLGASFVRLRKRFGDVCSVTPRFARGRCRGRARLCIALGAGCRLPNGPQSLRNDGATRQMRSRAYEIRARLPLATLSRAQRLRLANRSPGFAGGESANPSTPWGTA